MYYFIVNPNARRGLGNRLWRKLERLLKKRGIEYEAMLTEKPGDARIFAGQLAERSGEPRVVVAVGGNGTVNEIVDGLVFDRTVTIGYIPAGTGNDLARALKFPGSWKRCLNKIIKPKYHRLIDYGIISYDNGAPVHRRFLMSCGIGANAALCHSILESGRVYGRCPAVLGRLIYAVQGIRQLCRSVPVKGYLILDGRQKVEFNHIYFVSAHIHPYENGGFCFAPQADSGDGLLEVCVIHGTSRLFLLSVLFDAWFGKRVHHKGVRRYRCRNLRVHMEQPMPVHADGESCYCQTDIELDCIEKKVRIAL